MKLILQSIKSMIRGVHKRIDNLPQADYNQNDNTQKDYIKNRPFYSTTTTQKKETFLLEETVDITEDGGYKEISNSLHLEEGATYKVILNGVSYECVARYWEDEEGTLIGNGEVYGDGNPSNGEPFSCGSYIYDDGEVDIYLNVAKAGTYSIAIYKEELETVETIVKIDEKYLPDNVGIQSDYNQNDETQKDYIKNRPFYSELTVGETIFDETADFEEHYEDNNTAISLIWKYYDKYIEINKRYNVTWDGVVYESLLCKQDEGYDFFRPAIDFTSNTGLSFTITVSQTSDGNYYNITTNDMINTSHHIVITEVEETIKTIDKKFLPDNLAERVTNHEKRYMNDQFGLRDDVTGIDYVVKMHNGNLVYFKKCTGIRIASYPTNTNVIEGGLLDTTGMVVMGIHQDGSESEITNYKLTPVAAGSISTKITYEELGETYSVYVDINVIPIEDALIDFIYDTNSDGTYTITGWKGTLNGETSTRMIVPNSSKVIF